MTAKPWQVRVQEKIKLLEDRDNWSNKTFQDLCRYLAVDNNVVQVRKETADVSYRHLHAFSFKVDDAVVIVTSPSGDVARFQDVEMAADHMAFLMAIAFRKYDRSS